MYTFLFLMHDNILYQVVCVWVDVKVLIVNWFFPSIVGCVSLLLYIQKQEERDLQDICILFFSFFVSVILYFFLSFFLSFFRLKTMCKCYHFLGPAVVSLVSSNLFPCMSVCLYVCLSGQSTAIVSLIYLKLPKRIILNLAVSCLGMFRCVTCFHVKNILSLFSEFLCQ